MEAELAPLVHGLCRGLGTPYGYERAAYLLESQKSYSQAYAVLEAYLASGAVLNPATVKWRARLARAVLEAAP